MERTLPASEVPRDTALADPDRSCATCYYRGVAKMGDGSVRGVCRRHPPTTHINLVPVGGAAQLISQAVWPTVDDADWCGVFKRRLDG